MLWILLLFMIHNACTAVLYTSSCASSKSVVFIKNERYSVLRQRHFLRLCCSLCILLCMQGKTSSFLEEGTKREQLQLGLVGDWRGTRTREERTDLLAGSQRIAAMRREREKPIGNGGDLDWKGSTNLPATTAGGTEIYYTAWAIYYCTTTYVGHPIHATLCLSVIFRLSLHAWLFHNVQKISLRA